MHWMLDELKLKTDLLHKLLADPEPGLLSWNEAVQATWKSIADLWEHSKGGVS